MRRIWVLTELYFPEQTSTGYLLTQIAEGLTQQFEVKVITGPATNFLHQTTSANYEVKDGVEIYRCRRTNFSKDSIVGRLLNIATQSATILWASLIRCKQDDAILVVTNPPLLPFFALLIKWIKGCRVVLLIHDVYPEAIVASGLSTPNSILVKFGGWLSRILYNKVDMIVTLGRDMTKLAKAKLSDNHHKIHCIPNWAENEIVEPRAKAENPLLKELGITDCFVILYAGNIGRTHGIEYLVEAAKELQATNVHFIVLGFGAKKKWLEESVQRYNLKNVTLLPPRPRSEQIIFLNACDVALISFIKGMAGVSVPSRLYTQMAAGKPIIGVADDWSELAQVIQEEESGWVIEPGNIQGLVHIIQFAATHPALCQKMGNKAALAAKTKYSFQLSNQLYIRLFSELFSEDDY